MNGYYSPASIDALRFPSGSLWLSVSFHSALLPIERFELKSPSPSPQPLHEHRRLPFHHNDPFDRLVIAQLLVEDLTLISCDSEFPAYGVKLF